MASNLALQEKDKNHYLFFIDQDEVDNNLFYKAVLEWEDSPFTSVFLLPGRERSAIKKYTQRKKIFKLLLSKIRDFCPDEIRVGNDRRIEFQYSMHEAKKINSKVVGSYLDEGTYTYIGRKSSESFHDRIVDDFFKKIAYGSWWETPKTIGASGWISNAYLAFPNLAHKEIKKKNLYKIDSNIFKSKEILSLSEIICKSNNFNSGSLQNLDYLIALPHESIYLKDKLYRESMISLIGTLVKNKAEVAIKYHPRDVVQDGLSLSSIKQVNVIPSTVNFEALLTSLKACTIIGDVSSVLLLSKWLRPELHLLALTNDSVLSTPIMSVYEKLSIDTVHPEKIKNKLNLI